MPVKMEAEYRLKGSPICRGIAIGRPFFFSICEECEQERSINKEEVASEIERFRQAIRQSLNDIGQLQAQMAADHLSEGAAILDAHLQIMQDPHIHQRIEKCIKETLMAAHMAVKHVMMEYQQRLDRLKDPIFSQRSNDLREISRRIISYLKAAIRPSLAKIPAQSIVFAEDLSAPDVAEAVSSATQGFVTYAGGTTTHAAIVARAKGIPYVGNISVERGVLNRDSLVIVDGRSGEVIFNPSNQTLHYYQSIQDTLYHHFQKLETNAYLISETFDGLPVRLCANVESGGEVEMLHRYGGNGVGLCRTENLFILQDSFPSEEDQFIIYRSIVEQMRGLPISMRVFDIGGDKFFFNRQADQEINPFLGCRGIRLLLREREVFKTQVRAILRASLYGDVSILLPMVSELSELIETKQLIHEALVSLQNEGVGVHSLPIGCMIEVPSAALIADLLARECDFFSIGTNDLVQYSLAVDRCSHTINKMYAPTHPGALRLIKLVVDEATRHHVGVSLCGEIAADPRFTQLLLGLGIRELSMAPRHLPAIKNAIRNISIVSAHMMAKKVLMMTSSYEILQFLMQEYQRNVPEDCYYNC